MSSERSATFFQFSPFPARKDMLKHVKSQNGKTTIQNTAKWRQDRSILSSKFTKQ